MRSTSKFSKGHHFPHTFHQNLYFCCALYWCLYSTKFILQTSLQQNLFSHQHMPMIPLFYLNIKDSAQALQYLQNHLDLLYKWCITCKKAIRKSVKITSTLHCGLYPPIFQDQQGLIQT